MRAESGQNCHELKVKAQAHFFSFQIYENIMRATTRELDKFMDWRVAGEGGAFRPPQNYGTCLYLREQVFNLTLIYLQAI
jgi:hypothetical protein